jgi:hypothetical protein
MAVKEFIIFTMLKEAEIGSAEEQPIRIISTRIA